MILEARLPETWLGADWELAWIPMALNFNHIEKRAGLGPSLSPEAFVRVHTEDW